MYLPWRITAIINAAKENEHSSLPPLINKNLINSGYFVITWCEEPVKDLNVKV